MAISFWYPEIVRLAVLLILFAPACHWVLPLHGPPEDRSAPPIDGPRRDGDADSGDAAADHAGPGDGPGLVEGAVPDEQIPPIDKGGPSGEQAPPPTACSGSFVAFPFAPPTSSSINGVSCTSAKSIFAVGDTGLLLHFDGKWVQDNSTGFAYTVEDVWSPTAGGTTAYAVGAHESVLQHTGSAWSEIQNKASSISVLYGIWGSGPTDIWAVGSVGVYAHYNGSTWTGKTLGVTGYDLQAVWGDLAGNLYVAATLGMTGKVLKWDGSNPTPKDAFVTTFRPMSIWGSGPKDIWAVGSKGKAAHFDGLAWQEQPAAALTLNAIWGSGPQQIFAVGDSGEAVCYDGTGWKPVPTPANTPVLYDVSGCGTTVLAVGGQGTVLVYAP